MAALEMVAMTTTSAVSDYKEVNVTIFLFQCSKNQISLLCVPSIHVSFRDQLQRQMHVIT